MFPGACLVAAWSFYLIGTQSFYAATFSLNPSADAFVTTGPGGGLSSSNYGGAGTLAVAAPGLSQGEFQSVLQFNLAAAKTSFDALFGPGQWSIQSITLQLTATPANNPIYNPPAAGQFTISWMQNDSWLEGTGSPNSPGATGITYSSLLTLLSGSDENLGLFSLSGATNGASPYTLGLSSSFAADVLAGNNVSLRLFAADTTVSGVFNSRNFGTVANRPLLTIEAVPEPAVPAMVVVGLSLLAVVRRVTRRSGGGISSVRALDDRC